MHESIWAPNFAHNGQHRSFFVLFFFCHTGWTAGQGWLHRSVIYLLNFWVLCPILCMNCSLSLFLTHTHTHTHTHTRILTNQTPGNGTHHPVYCHVISLQNRRKKMACQHLKADKKLYNRADQCPFYGGLFWLTLYASSSWTESDCIWVHDTQMCLISYCNINLSWIPWVTSWWDIDMIERSIQAIYWKLLWSIFVHRPWPLFELFSELHWGQTAGERLSCKLQVAIFLKYHQNIPNSPLNIIRRNYHKYFIFLSYTLQNSTRVLILFFSLTF